MKQEQQQQQAQTSTAAAAAAAAAASQPTCVNVVARLQVEDGPQPRVVHVRPGGVALGHDDDREARVQKPRGQARKSQQRQLQRVRRADDPVLVVFRGGGARNTGGWRRWVINL